MLSCGTHSDGMHEPVGAAGSGGAGGTGGATSQASSSGAAAGSNSGTSGAAGAVGTSGGAGGSAGDGASHAGGQAGTPANGPTPADPQATPEARALLAFLYSIQGSKILSGQMGEKWDPGNTDDRVFARAGAYPAVYGMDFLFGDSNRQKATSACIERHEQNAIIQLSWHAVQPDKPESDDTGWNDMHSGKWPTDKIDLMLTPGTDLHREWMVRLDHIGGYLRQLQNTGVPVLWRPFHEMNFDWFWWGKQARFAELWNQMFDRFTNHLGLHNILWVWSPNYDYNGAGPYADYYPGHAQVDIVACDIYENYKHSYSKWHYDKLWEIGAGRPIAIGENGDLPPVATLFEQGMPYVWWMTWNGFEYQYKNTLEWYDTVYADPRVLVRGESP
jgi:mannan endo-1,4-beta-mannosidase